jgi:hypothetical protein
VAGAGAQGGEREFLWLNLRLFFGAHFVIAGYDRSNTQGVYQPE